MKNRRNHLLAAATALLIAAALLAGLINSASGQTLPPDQGTPAAGQAAPDISLLPVWEDPGVYDTDPDQILPPGGSVTFTEPVVVAGDVEVVNESGGVVSLYDCRTGTACSPKTGTTVRVEASQAHPITVRFPWGGSWWLEGSRGSPPTTFADLACQQVEDGCALIESVVVCSDAVDVFVARWVPQGSSWRLDVQVSADPGATVLRGGPRYDMTAAQRIEAGLALDYCVPAPTPTATSTPTRTPTTPPPTATATWTPTSTATATPTATPPTATPTATSVPPTPTVSPTTTPTTPPVCEGVVIKLSKRSDGGSWVAFGNPSGYPSAVFWYGLPPYHYTWELRFELTGRPGVVYQWTHVEVNGAGQAQRPNPFTYGPFTPYGAYHFLFTGSADGVACGQWDFGGNADPIVYEVFLPIVIR